MSFGKGGKRAYDTVFWLHQMVDQVKPDVVITLLGINDLSWAGGPGWAARDIDAALVKQKIESLWFPVNTPNGFVRPPGQWFLAEMQRYNRLQPHLALRHDMTFVDLDAGIAKTLENYFDDCHFTDKGSRAVAEIVVPALERVLQTAIAKGDTRR